MNRHSHTQDHFPNAISKKVTLLRHFQGYMRDNLSQVCRKEGYTLSYMIFRPLLIIS